MEFPALIVVHQLETTVTKSIGSACVLSWHDYNMGKWQVDFPNTVSYFTWLGFHSAHKHPISLPASLGLLYHDSFLFQSAVLIGMCIKLI